MTEHLPECPDQHSSHDGTCICPQLRACEQRVADDIWGAIRDGSQYKSGFEAGLDAARGSVAAAKAVDISAGHVLDESRYFVWMHDALSAIDTLINPPSLPPTTGRAHKY